MVESTDDAIELTEFVRLSTGFKFAMSVSSTTAVVVVDDDDTGLADMFVFDEMVAFTGVA